MRQLAESFLITDVGSTTTKAILVGPRDGEYRLLGRGEMPTTVEVPHEDVTVGVLGALADLGRKVGCDLVSGGRPARFGPDGMRKYLSTSSAGGGLQVMVFGVMKNVTASSARKAALGGGAIILDVMCTDDDRPTFEKLDAIRNAKPDMVLISGGIDGGNTQFALEIADLLNAANPRPRFGEGFRIPVIYAGNKEAAPLVLDTLRETFDVKVVDNLRPAFDREVLEPARDAIHELFMSHVMAMAPGYQTLRDWVDADIMPTPAAVGEIMRAVSSKRDINILGMDIGGATTDIFSVTEGIFNRSVSANLGMSYSAGNVLLEAGIENTMRWLPFEASAGEVSDSICTKLVNPTSLPRSVRDLQIEQALATEALRLAFLQHREVAMGLPRDIDAAGSPFKTQDRMLRERLERKTLVDIVGLDLLVGSGGVLSHAPRRQQAALMMLNAFLPVGVTHLAVDSIFMMPHLGVLSRIRPDIALSVLEKDCFVPLGTVVAPEGDVPPGDVAVSVRVHRSGEREDEVEVKGGDITVIPLPAGRPATIRASAMGRAAFPSGAEIVFESSGGSVGLIIDARGRPLPAVGDAAARASRNSRWARQIGAFE